MSGRPVVRKGQEWEKRDGSRMVTRVRVLEDLPHPQSARVKVGTVTKDGRVIRVREILASALSNTPSGYRLVQDAPAPASTRTHRSVEPCPHTMKALQSLLRDDSASGMDRIAAMSEAEVDAELAAAGVDVAAFEERVRARVDTVRASLPPLTRVREAIQRHVHPDIERAEALATLATLERALPVLLESHHRDRRGNEDGHHGRDWWTCPECKALLEGKS